MDKSDARPAAPAPPPDSILLSRLLDLMSQAVTVQDASGGLRYANAHRERILGYPADSPAPFPLTVHPDDLELGWQMYKLAQESPGQRVTSMNRVQRADGSWCPVECTWLNLIDDPEVHGMVALWHDVQERERATAQVRLLTRQWQELTGDAIVITDLKGRVLAWNKGAEQQLGWTAEEVLGQELAWVNPEERPAAIARIRQVAEERRGFTFEAERVAKDGRLVPLLTTLSPLIDQEGVAGVLSVSKDMSAWHELEAKSRELALLRERQRIAMDLHDGVIQSLYGVGLTLGALALHEGRATLPSGEDLDQAVRRINETIDALRTYVSALSGRNGGAEPLDVAAALNTYAREARTASPADIQVDVAPEVQALLEQGAAANLMAIAHEALSNAIRHSQARHIAVRLERGPRGVRLTVSDDGKGFLPASAGRRRGDGLRNMRRRAGAIGARLRVSSQPGNGTTVQATLKGPDTSASPV
ncbi:MAG: PAS domain S-box protein [Chloroflexi bacterium]|nr:PAS domain S-box protein [Chloroflexota bacterium]